jgi:predicted ABC-type transport system involved in lysophospholipase L1 biosynthesis ATPase subunit
MLARAMAAKPGVLLVNGLLDILPEDERLKVLDVLRAKDAAWTTVIATRMHSIAEKCEHRIELT